MFVEVDLWNAFPVVTAALPPGVMFALPMLGAMGLPHVPSRTQLRLVVVFCA